MPPPHCKRERPASGLNPADSTKRAVEGVFPPTLLPNDERMEDENEVAIVKTNCFGIRAEVPVLALPDAKGLKISVRTLSESSVKYLAEEFLSEAPSKEAEALRSMQQEGQPRAPELRVIKGDTSHAASEVLKRRI